MRWILAILVLGSLHAAHLEVTGELLYWKASSQGTFFGTSSTKLFYVRPKYEPGFRIQLRHVFDSGCYDLNFSYINVESRQIKETSQLLNFPPIGADLSGARASVKYNYNTADISLGVNFCRGSERLIRLFVGLEGVEIDERQNFFYGNNQPFYRKPCYQALGPLIGIGAQYCICKMFKVISEVGVSALFGKRDLTTTDQFFPSSNGVSPGFRVKIGMNYTYSCLRAEVGYMARHYPNAFVETLVRDPTGQPRPDICTEDVTYGGPYASLTVRF